jgi:hypothetical protein
VVSDSKYVAVSVLILVMTSQGNPENAAGERVRATLPTLAVGTRWAVSDEAQCRAQSRVVTRDKATGRERDPENAVVGSITALTERDVTIQQPPTSSNVLEGSIAFTKATLVVAGQGGQSAPLIVQGKTYSFASTPLAEPVLQTADASELAVLRKDRFIDLAKDAGHDVAERKNGQWFFNDFGWWALAGRYLDPPSATGCGETSNTDDQLIIKCNVVNPKTPGVTQELRIEISFEATTDVVRSLKLKANRVKRTVMTAAEPGAEVVTIELVDCDVSSEQKRVAPVATMPRSQLGIFALRNEFSIRQK